MLSYRPPPPESAAVSNSVNILRRELGEAINLLRQDTLRSADEKFSLVQMDLQRYIDELARIKVTTTDYSPYFAEKLGPACWEWLGPDARKMFNTSENLFHYFSPSDQL